MQEKAWEKVRNKRYKAEGDLARALKARQTRPGRYLAAFACRATRSSWFLRLDTVTLSLGNSSGNSSETGPDHLWRRHVNAPYITLVESKRGVTASY